MTPEAMKKRTKAFGLDIIRLVASLPASTVAKRLGDQLLRSATSVGANYRAACRAKSRADFVAKMGIVEEEADESLYWLELLDDLAIADPGKTAPLLAEASQLVAIVVASINTARPARKNVF
jgi:four helix bundle protein